MTAQVCPYLCAVDDPDKYYPTPDGANSCHAVSSGGPAHIPLDFQEGFCLAGRFDLCSRYKAAGRLRTRRQARRLFVVGGGLGTMVMFAGCSILVVLALILGGLGASRLGFLARVTDTPQPTATPSLTWTATASSTPTERATNIATATPQPIPPTATVSPVNSPGGEFVSSLSTPPLEPTATRPQPTATWPRPAPTRRPLPTPTRWLVPTLTRGPTVTPWPTITRAPTSTPLVICYSGDTMTFNPAGPTPGETFFIEVRSFSGYADVSLTGAGSPRFRGVSRDGSYYVWRWEDSFDTAGTYTYSFKIRSGAATCVTKAVLVAAPTNTPTPTPTATPVYDFGLALNGVDFKPIFTDSQPVVFGLTLTNGGNVTDSFQVGLDAAPPNGWTAQYCIGDSCSDYTVPGTQVTLPQGGSQALSIRLIAASDAQGGHALSVTLWVQSLGDPTKRKSQSVTVVVTKPASSP
jgi:hypothetical protein